MSRKVNGANFSAIMFISAVFVIWPVKVPFQQHLKVCLETFRGTV